MYHLSFHFFPFSLSDRIISALVVNHPEGGRCGAVLVPVLCRLLYIYSIINLNLKSHGYNTRPDDVNLLLLHSRTWLPIVKCINQTDPFTIAIISL